MIILSIAKLFIKRISELGYKIGLTHAQFYIGGGELTYFVGGIAST